MKLEGFSVFAWTFFNMNYQRKNNIFFFFIKAATEIKDKYKLTLRP